MPNGLVRPCKLQESICHLRGVKFIIISNFGNYVVFEQTVKTLIRHGSAASDLGLHFLPKSIYGMPGTDVLKFDHDLFQWVSNRGRSDGV